MDRSVAARWRIPALVAVLTAIAIALGWALSPASRPITGASGGTGSSSSDGATSTASSGHRPPVLYFRANASEAVRAPMSAAANAVATSKMAGPHDAYTFNGTFPKGPASAPIFTFAEPTAEQVNRLAAAFGLPAAKHTPDMWTATDGKHQLSVQTGAGGNWWYGGVPYCLNGGDETTGNCAVSSGVVDGGPAGTTTGGGTSVGGTSSGGTSSGGTTGGGTSGGGVAVSGTVVTGGPVATGGTVVTGGPVSVGAPAAPCEDCALPTPDFGPVPTDDSTVRNAAAGILAAAGIALDRARITVGFGTLTVSPLVDGLPTIGLETSISVDADGRVQLANGWLGVPVKGENYPVITAEQAFETLKAQPRMYAMRCPAPLPAVKPGAEAGTNSDPNPGSGAPPTPNASLAPDSPPSTPVGGTPPAKPPVSAPAAGSSSSPAFSGGGPVMVDPPSDIEMPCGNFTPQPVAVTGARFGLSVQWQSDNGPVLAPAWLFTTKGNDSWPMPMLAIDPAFLGTATDVPLGKVATPDAVTGTPAKSPVR